jgi:hypothetical protein
MMRLQNIQMTSTVKRTELLNKLVENLKEHKIIVKEAKEGYIKKAREALTARLQQLERLEPVNLQFTLQQPMDYSEVYETCISMLQWSRDDLVTLAADEFRQLVLDEWDWQENFLTSSSLYSATATRKRAR